MSVFCWANLYLYINYTIQRPFSNKTIKKYKMIFFLFCKTSGQPHLWLRSVCLRITRKRVTNTVWFISVTTINLKRIIIRLIYTHVRVLFAHSVVNKYARVIYFTTGKYVCQILRMPSNYKNFL